MRDLPSSYSTNFATVLTATGTPDSNVARRPQTTPYGDRQSASNSGQKVGPDTANRGPGFVRRVLWSVPWRSEPSPNGSPKNDEHDPDRQRRSDRPGRGQHDRTTARSVVATVPWPARDDKPRPEQTERGSPGPHVGGISARVSHRRALGLGRTTWTHRSAGRPSARPGWTPPNGEVGAVPVRCGWSARRWWSTPPPAKSVKGQ
jgi:hypothetical protein